MEYNTPRHILNEKDLNSYEDYLNEVCSPSAELTVRSTGNEAVNNLRPMPAKSRKPEIMPQVLSNAVFFQGYLKGHIGKLVKVESLLGDRLEARIGVLMDVGSDYIVLKLRQSCCSMMIQSSCVKYITIAHDNDMTKVII